MNHVAAQILGLVARLFPEEFADLDGYCSRHAAFLDDGILRAYQELQFYLAYLDYIGPLRAAGLSFCYPEVSARLEGRQRRWHLRPGAGRQARGAGDAGGH